MPRRKSDIMLTDNGRRYRRDGVTLCWPERNLGDLWKPGAVAAEVKRALSRPEHSKCEAPPEPVPEPPPQMSLNAMARQLGISPAGLFQRVKRHGWSKAVAMGGRKAHRWAA